MKESRYLPELLPSSFEACSLIYSASFGIDINYLAVVYAELIHAEVKEMT